MTTDEELLSWQIAAARQLTQPRLASKPSSSIEAGVDSDRENRPFQAIEVERSIRTLERKRRHQLLAQLPTTARAIKSQFPPLADAFIRGHHFNGLWAVQDDAIAFAQWLRLHETVPLWIRQLARWESLTLMFRRYPYCLRISHFQYDFGRWFRRGQCPSKPPSRGFTVVLTFRANTLGMPHWILYRQKSSNKVID